MELWAFGFQVPGWVFVKIEDFAVWVQGSRLSKL